MMLRGYSLESLEQLKLSKKILNKKMKFIRD